MFVAHLCTRTTAHLHTRTLKPFTSSYANINVCVAISCQIHSALRVHQVHVITFTSMTRPRSLRASSSTKLKVSYKHQRTVFVLLSDILYVHV